MADKAAASANDIVRRLAERWKQEHGGRRRPSVSWIERNIYSGPMWAGTHTESKEYARFLAADDFLMSIIECKEVLP